MRPDQVVEQVTRSGLRSRGGAGYPTGLKWQTVAKADGGNGKFVICNADEGDPGAFMDRSVLEGDPQRLHPGRVSRHACRLRVVEQGRVDHGLWWDDRDGRQFCMVDVAKYFMDFCREESCGECVPCRVGTVQLHGLLVKITSGQATIDDLAMLVRLSDVVRNTSLCGLGQGAPNPVLSTIRYFRDEYLAHIEERTCRPGSAS
jgi:NADH:ubiquinone oxidoreductase subunit F (NADH-binding)